MKQITLILFSVLVGISSWAAAPGDLIKSLPVQDGGRIKPYDSFAREVLELVYGKKTFEGHEAYEIVFTWLLTPEAWQEKKIFELKNFEVAKALGLSAEQRYFSGPELFGSQSFSTVMGELRVKREAKEKLTPYFQALQRLENQFAVFQAIANGSALRVMPSKEGQTWIALPDLSGDQQSAFMQLTKAFVAKIAVLASENPDQSALAKTGADLDAKVSAFMALGKGIAPEVYPSESAMGLEVHYNSFHPFRFAYIFYLIGALMMLFFWITKRNTIQIAWLMTFLGFALHSYGFLLRVYLTGRAPVSNMYETVVWVSWGTLVFAMILEKVYSFRFILFAGQLVGVFALVIADSAPAILDSTLQPLEPVLRSNFWLTTHVMTITISYAAFFLAFGLGDIGLFYYLRGEAQNKTQIKNIVQAIYRAMQIGVAFLAPGIILGGVWADYSWGRFWGWDPKETWALIALLGYVAVLHARLAGMLREFGLVAAAIGSFSLVIMAWYGVNFVLGAGLHSYGFGAGGLEYVSAFVVLHLAAVGYVAFLRRTSADKLATHSK